MTSRSNKRFWRPTRRMVRGSLDTYAHNATVTSLFTLWRCCHYPVIAKVGPSFKDKFMEAQLPPGLASVDMEKQAAELLDWSRYTHPNDITKEIPTNLDVFLRPSLFFGCTGCETDGKDHRPQGNNPFGGQHIVVRSAADMAAQTSYAHPYVLFSLRLHFEFGNTMTCAETMYNSSPARYETTRNTFLLGIFLNDGTTAPDTQHHTKMVLDSALHR